MINWGHVLYAKYVPYLFVLTLLGSLGLFLQSFLQLQLAIPGTSIFKDLFEAYFIEPQKLESVQAHVLSIYYTLGWKWTLLVFLASAYMWHSSKPVYLIDFACFQPPKDWQVSQQDIMRIMREVGKGKFTEAGTDA